MESENNIMSCADGLTQNGGHCSHEMFAELSAPGGWFESLCPVTCGTCPDGGGGGGDGSNYDASPPSPDSGSSLFPTPSHCADDDATLAIVTQGTVSSCADGVAMSSYLCSDDGFTSLCPVTCGTCSDCADDDDRVFSDSQNHILSCAFGFAISGYACTDEMFVDSFGAPTGWFKSVCPDTCGMCPNDGSSDDHADNPCEHLCSLATCFSYEAMARPECADCCSCLNHWNPCPFSASSCGDGVCDLKEGEGYDMWASCYVDCHCGDGWCDPNPPGNETWANCPADCTSASASCGNGVCEPEANETAATCYEDCHCGDGFCDRRFGPGVGLGGGLGGWAWAWAGAGARAGARLGLGLGILVRVVGLAIPHHASTTAAATS